MGFNMLFYIIFGTNLLTEGPVLVSVFFPILVLRRKGISNGIQTERNLREDLSWNKRNPGDLEKLFLEGNTPDGLGPHVRRYGSFPRGWAAPPLGRAPCLVGPPWLP